MLGHPVLEGAGDGGGAAGYLQPGVDILQVLAYGSFGDAEPSADLGIGVAVGDQVQQVPVPRGELGNRTATPFGVQVGLVKVGAQQGEQRPVTFPNRPVARRISRLSLASIVTDSLCGSTPMTTLSITYASSPQADHLAGEDGQRYFELSRAFLSRASPRHPARTHAMKEPHPAVQAGSRKESDPAGHLTRACASPGGHGRHK